MRKWIIFECPNRGNELQRPLQCDSQVDDGSIVVSRLEGDRALGVCECPDLRTAEAVMEAMRLRDISRSERGGDAPQGRP